MKKFIVQFNYALLLINACLNQIIVPNILKICIHTVQHDTLCCVGYELFNAKFLFNRLDVDDIDGSGHVVSDKVHAVSRNIRQASVTDMKAWAGRCGRSSFCTACTAWKKHFRPLI